MSDQGPEIRTVLSVMREMDKAFGQLVSASDTQEQIIFNNRLGGLVMDLNQILIAQRRTELNEKKRGL